VIEGNNTTKLGTWEDRLTHSSDLRTMQEIFHVTKPFFLGDALHGNDLSDLFAPGVITGKDE